MAINLGITEVVAPAISGDIFISQAETRQLDIVIKHGTGKNYTRGTILGKITATGEYTKWDNRTSGAATDGSEIPVGVLLNDTNASGATDEKATIAISGEFNKSYLTAKTTVVEGVYNTWGTIMIKSEVA